MFEAADHFDVLFWFLFLEANIFGDLPCFFLLLQPVSQPNPGKASCSSAINSALAVVTSSSIILRISTISRDLPLYHFLFIQISVATRMIYGILSLETRIREKWIF